MPDRTNFIPKPYRKDQVTIRVDRDKLERMDAVIAKYGLNRSEFINRCIDFAMQHMSDDELQGKDG